MSKSRPQKYFVPELNMEIKVEVVGSSNVYCAHFPTGPERVTWSEVRQSDWQYKGEWTEENK